MDAHQLQRMRNLLFDQVQFLIYLATMCVCIYVIMSVHVLLRRRLWLSNIDSINSRVQFCVGCKYCCRSVITTPILIVFQGYLDEQFIQLEELQDEANPNFVEEVVSLFYSDSARLIRNMELTLYVIEFNLFNYN